MTDDWCEGMLLQEFLREYVKPVVTSSMMRKTPAGGDDPKLLHSKVSCHAPSFIPGAHAPILKRNQLL